MHVAGVVTISVVLALVAGCGSAAQERPGTLAAASSSPVPGSSPEVSEVRVPALSGRSAGAAVKELGSVGLAVVGPTTGIVTGSDPAAGTLVPRGSAVRLVVSDDAPVTDDADDVDGLDGGLEPALTSLVEGDPTTYVGLYRAGDGVVVVVAPGADKDAALARARSTTARRVTVRRCDRSLEELQQVATAVTSYRWLPAGPRPTLGATVMPRTCSVEVTAQLTDEQREALTGAFGSAVTYVPGSVGRTRG